MVRRLYASTRAQLAHAAAVVVPLSLLLFVVLPAQTRGSCSVDCAIDLQLQTTISDPSGALPTEAILLTPDRVGRYLMTSKTGSQILVIDRRGRVTKTVSGASKQPFKLVTSVLIGQDGFVRAYDTFARTLFRLDKQLEVAETAPFRFMPFFVLDDKTYIHVGQIRTADLVGQPLHVIGLDGRVVRSFGSTDASYRADQPFKFDRVATLGSKNTVWSAAPGRYLVEQWDPQSGRRLTGIAVKSAWFTESDKPTRPYEKPHPFILSLWEADGCVWVLSQDADKNWRPEIVPKPESKFDAELYDQNWDWVLEAISLKSGTVIATRRFDRAVWGQFATFLLVTRRPATGNTSVKLEVWQPRLIPKRR